MLGLNCRDWFASCASLLPLLLAHICSGKGYSNRISLTVKVCHLQMTTLTAEFTLRKKSLVKVIPTDNAANICGHFWKANSNNKPLIITLNLMSSCIPPWYIHHMSLCKSFHRSHWKVRAKKCTLRIWDANLWCCRLSDLTDTLEDKADLQLNPPHKKMYSLWFWPVALWDGMLRECHKRRYKT